MAKEDAKRTATEQSVKDGVRELVLREGKAEEIREKKVISYGGVITCPREFWQNRHDEHDHHKEEHAYVKFSKEEKTIVLVVNENSYWSKTVTGKLLSNPKLDAFGINEEEFYGSRELCDFLRMRKFYFKNQEEATKMINNLMKFKASITTELAKENDRKGNTNDQVVRRVKHEIPLEFTLKMPVFKGQPDREFRVEIEVDATDGEVRFYLVSEELAQIELEDLDSIFEAELKPFREALVVCLEH